MKPSNSIRYLRSLVPATKHHKLFNFAATSPLLQPSANRMAEIAQQGTEPISCHFDDWLELIESGRRLIANTINASPDEISFVGNTSTGLSLIAASIPWRAGDRVLYDASDFPSNRLVWENLKRFGVIAVPVKRHENRSFEQIIEAMDLSNIKLVACSAVSYIDGRQTNIKELVDRCHAHDTLVCVDAIQAVGHIPVDVKLWGCDFMACGGQKWLMGPVGSGFIYINRNMLEQLHVPMVGWASMKNAGDFQDKRLSFIEGARRFEPGLPDVGAIAGLSTSIETLSSVGLSRIFSDIKKNADRLRSTLDGLGYQPNPQLGHISTNGIVCIKFQNRNLLENVADHCQANQILITKRNTEIRLAPHAITTTAEIDSLLNIFAIHAPRKSKVPATNRLINSRHDQKLISLKDTDIAASGRADNNQGKKFALVTGASRGLGESIAHALAKRGYQLTLVGRELSKLQQVAGNIQQEFSVPCEIKALNLCQPVALARWLASLPPTLHYDIIVNNAAQGDAQLFTDTNIEKLRTLFEINFFAAFSITQHFIPAMLERKTGAILNIVTTGSRCAMPLFSSYNASKASLWAWSEALSREVADQGISVTTYLPPHMNTNMANYLGRRALSYFKRSKANTKSTSPHFVGEHAVKSLLAGRTLVLPFDAKMKLIANAISDKIYTGSLAKSWRGASQKV